MIEDANGNIISSKDENGWTNLRVASIDGYEWDTKSKPLLNDTYGPNLNQNAAASGTPDGVHNGTDTALWTGSSLSGTWDFASTAQAQAGTKSIDATGTTNGDQAQLERSSAIASSSYNSLSGYIYLTSYNPSKNQILLQFRLAGVNVGVSVNLGDVIDTGVLNAWQSFDIPLSNFSLIGNIDQLIIQTVRTSGSPPDYYLDTVQLEEAGTLIYSAEADQGTIFEFQTFDMILVDDLVGTLVNNSMPALAYNKILNLSSLTNGITIRRFKGDEVQFSLVARKLSDFLFAAFEIGDVFGDGTNTLIKLRARLDWWAPLDFRTRDRLEIVIADDLSSLIEARAVIRGRERKY
jgi:hypothetical protein